MSDNYRNPYALFSTDPVEHNAQWLKAKLGITLIQLIRSKGWNQAETAAALQVAQPRVSDLKRGKLEKFSIDMMFTMLFRLGYYFEYEHSFESGKPSLQMKLKEKQ
ncbi:hypothetical protein [Xanthomonas phage XAJ2]|uniref:HigA2-like helix-turn-helix domain-containing protein n=1 Tax=Xanthomonas phage XAJ2 TaxID=1775249 RepID=A0A1I9L2L2_9CAUD|nr:hypothetical protein [Xanthomonas phage XAJ2]